MEPLSLNGNGEVHGNGHGGLAESVAVADDGVKDQLFLDRAWALHVVERTVEAVGGEWEAAGKAERFAVLRAFLPGAVGDADYGEAADRLGMSAVAVRTEVSRLRARFRSRLRGEVAATVSIPEEVEDELRHLCAVFVRVADTPPALLPPQLAGKS